MGQKDFKIPGLSISDEKLDNANSEHQERTEQVWQDSHMLFTFEKGSGEDELPTDIDVDTIFLDYYSSDSSLLENEVSQTREVVLVLPGIGMDLEVNRNFLESLAKTGRKVVSLSMPGCGDSGDPNQRWRIESTKDGEKTKKWTSDFSNYSTLLNRLIDELKFQGKIGKDEKIRVVGHSLGGVMGAEFAANNSDKISALDLIAPGGYKKTNSNSIHIYPATTGEFIWKQGKEVLDRIRQVGSKEVPNIIRRMWVNNFIKKDHKFDWANLEDEGVGVLPRMLQRLWEAEVVLQGSLEENIKQVSSQLPIKILVGENDKLFPPVDYQSLVSKLHNSGIEVEMEIISDSGHYGCILNSDEFVKAL